MRLLKINKADAIRIFDLAFDVRFDIPCGHSWNPSPLQKEEGRPFEIFSIKREGFIK